MRTMHRLNSPKPLAFGSIQTRKRIYLPLRRKWLLSLRPAALQPVRMKLSNDFHIYSKHSL